jgi:hypothetical protein
MLLSIRCGCGRRNTGPLWTAGALMAASTLLGVAVDPSRAAPPRSTVAIAVPRQPQTAFKFSQQPHLVLTNRSIAEAAATKTGAEKLAAARTQFRVCAAPDNRPLANRQSEGFDNKIAQLLATADGKPLVYAWWPERRGFIHNTLNHWECDVVMGVPTGYELTATTRPYCCSTDVMPAWGQNLNIDPYIDDLWAYLKARADGVLGPGRPQKLVASSSDGSQR